ncbi:MAG: hypothetical protein WBK77_07590 [Alphaproteobacteria bacterium]
MKIGKILLAAIALLAIGGAGFLFLVDVPVAQTEISREIPHDQFSQ